MNCDEVMEQAREFIEGRLSEDEEERIDAHLKECKECEAAFNKLIESDLNSHRLQENQQLLHALDYALALEPEEEERHIQEILESAKQWSEANRAEALRNFQQRIAAQFEIEEDWVQILRIPENREAVRVLSKRVLVEVALDEVEVTADLIDPLIAEASRGKMIPVSLSYAAGGFGGADVMVKAVVPAVVEAVSLMLKGLDSYNLEEIKGREITVKEIKPIVDRTKSRKGRSKIRQLVQALNNAFGEYLEA